MTHALSITDYRQITKKARKNKYRAMRTVVDGFKFHSKKEAMRWVVLRQMERNGEISDLERQPKFKLYAHRAGEYRECCKYIADFRYRRNGQTIVEDVKGMDTRLSKLKRTWLFLQEGIEVVLT